MAFAAVFLTYGDISIEAYKRKVSKLDQNFSKHHNNNMETRTTYSQDLYDFIEKKKVISTLAILKMLDNTITLLPPHLDRIKLIFLPDQESLQYITATKYTNKGVVEK